MPDRDLVAAKALEPLSEEGETRASLECALVFARHATRENWEKAYHHAFNGAKAGDPDCLAMLATFTYSGLCVTADREKGYQMAKDATERGSVRALSVVAAEEFKQAETEEGKRRALEEAKRGAKAGNADCSFLAATFAHTLAGDDADEAAYVEALKKAERDGSMHATFALGKIMTSTGPNANSFDGMERLRKAAGAIPMAAVTFVGKALSTPGATLNLHEAKEMLIRAANMGCKQAFGLIGMVELRLRHAAESRKRTAHAAIVGTDPPFFQIKRTRLD